jgi:hypothetical protein
VAVGRTNVIPDPLSKTQLLQKLRDRIESEIANPWFYPQRGTVAGFLGSGPLIIVGWRPSMSMFPDEGANRLFYEILSEAGLENAHLTNFIKSRGRKGEPDPPDRARHESIFDEEFRIISPPCLVAPMGDAYDGVAAFLMQRGARPVARLPQYASMNYGQPQITTFRRAVKQLADTIGKL